MEMEKSGHDFRNRGCLPLGSRPPTIRYALFLLNCILLACMTSGTAENAHQAVSPRWMGS